MVSLIPTPQSLQYLEGFFTITANTCVDARAVALREEIFRFLGKAPAFIGGNSRIDMEISDDIAHPQGYIVEIETSGIRVIAQTEQGLFYASTTLRQLIRIHGLRLPCMRIKDAPRFSTRGALHMMAQGRVSRLFRLKELVDTLSFYKINQLHLCFGPANFPYTGMSEARFEDSVLTAKEIRELDEYCKERFVELVPAMACFGHLYELLRTRSFSKYCELEVECDRPFNFVDVMRHHTISPAVSGSLDVSRQLIMELAQHFTSPCVNITCDETFDLGLGKSALRCETEGKHTVYMEYVLQLIETVKCSGKRAMMWGDILSEHPEYTKQLPDDVILLNWDYAPCPNEEKLKYMAQSGKDFYVCPTVNGYNRFINAMTTASKNIRASVELAERYKAAGILVTDWGDYGHVNGLALSFSGFAFSAALSWNSSDTCTDDEFDAAFSHLQFPASQPLIPIIRKAAQVVRFEWFDFVFYTYHNRGYAGVENGYTNLCKKTENLSLTEIEANVQTLCRLRTDFTVALTSGMQDSHSMREMQLALDGEILAARFGMAMKRLGTDSEISSNLYMLATDLEEWYIWYEEIFLFGAKPSRIERVKEIFRMLAADLRDGKGLAQ